MDEAAMRERIASNTGYLCGGLEGIGLGLSVGAATAIYLDGERYEFGALLMVGGLLSYLGASVVARALRLPDRP